MLYKRIDDSTELEGQYWFECRGGVDANHAISFYVVPSPDSERLAELGRKVWEADRISAWIDAGVSARECLAKMSEMMRQHDWYDAAIYLDNLADALKEMEHE